ncbi:class I SAM-dependent methyltransferase [Streptomyces sp. NPDC050485]|uniref:class I SAM-dependent methyltransferase n=1 Tax=Streptomyces sp. NPDC050485 TaxID=3365617 RepID=UPI0037AA8E03
MTTPIIDGLERLADRPALVYEGRVWTGADVLEEARLTGPRPPGSAGPEALFAHLAAALDGRDSGSLAVLRAALGDDPVKVVIAAPPAGFGGDAALASWSSGATVHLGDGLTPAEALTLLEHTAADRAVLPAALLRELVAHPAATITELSAVRRVVHDGGPVDVAGVFDAETVGVDTGLDERTVARLAAETAAAADDELAGIDLAEAVAAVERLGATALLSMLNSLRRNGLFTSPDAAHTEDEVLAGARVAAEHRPLIRRWLRVLAEQGMIHRDGDRLCAAIDAEYYSDTALERDWKDVEQAWLATAGAAGTLDYARRNAERLPELMTGAVQAVLLLFPQGRTDLARALYRESVTARYQHRAVSAFVSGVGRESRRRLRILEVGAGTGATSEVLLPALSGMDVDYLYTDVSRYFLDAAAEYLAPYPWVRTGLFDIDEPPREQGLAPHSFDVVVGGGVLNAARDTDASVGWLTELLEPGGWLVITEPTVEEFWVMASQAFMLPAADDERADSGSTFLTLPQWNRVLDDAGLERVLGLPTPSHPLQRLGHRVFAARAPRPADSRAAGFPTEREDDHA